MTSVYVHKFPNGKVYVGISDNPVERWGGGMGYASNRSMYADIKRYGWKNIEHVIVSECATREEAQRLERKYILLYDSENPKKGYNRLGKHRDKARIVRAKNLFAAAIQEAGLDVGELKLRNFGTEYGIFYHAYFIGYYNPGRRTFRFGRQEQKTYYFDAPSEKPLALVLLEEIADTVCS